MNWIMAILIGWLLVRMVESFIAWLKKPSRRKVVYRLTSEENMALALAHPMADGRMGRSYAGATLPRIKPELAQRFRPQLLHLFGLPTNLSDSAIKEKLPAQLKHYWYRIDLDRLSTDDDPYAALAFACARIAFSVRVAAMMRWISSDLQWQILHLNANRACQCFAGWHDYGAAWSRGRLQWVSRSRADSLGVPFSESDVKQWLGNRRHPWRRITWSCRVVK
jgi:hypothetical protein